MKYVQHGISLIEVLVTLLILSVGLLGVAGLQSLSIRDGVSSYFNTRAQTATNDIIDRIIANKEQALTGSYANAIPSASPTPNCDTASCTPAQIVNHDLWQVFDTMNSANALPQSALTITYNMPSSEYSIALTWDASGDGDDYSAPTCTDANPATVASGCMFTMTRLQ